MHFISVCGCSMRSFTPLALRSGGQVIRGNLGGEMKQRVCIVVTAISRFLPNALLHFPLPSLKAAVILSFYSIFFAHLYYDNIHSKINLFTSTPRGVN